MPDEGYKEYHVGWALVVLVAGTGLGLVFSLLITFFM